MLNFTLRITIRIYKLWCSSQDFHQCHQICLPVLVHVRVYLRIITLLLLIWILFCVKDLFYAGNQMMSAISLGIKTWRSVLARTQKQRFLFLSHGERFAYCIVTLESFDIPGLLDSWPLKQSSGLVLINSIDIICWSNSELIQGFLNIIPRKNSPACMLQWL